MKDSKDGYDLFSTWCEYCDTKLHKFSCMPQIDAPSTPETPERKRGSLLQRTESNGSINSRSSSRSTRSLNFDGVEAVGELRQQLLSIRQVFFILSFAHFIYISFCSLLLLFYTRKYNV